ncbi:hypothetical protein [Sphingomonas turrisvirgatae]|uniref:Uncharacterized protein n=1 Tax=Sphingomonas turrisvirgatae TaxID=1888892 RepID=A0A1E3M2I2_9SPHN|nr:hypothetical protein [Sphingomonas turrisvirgatae]ODP39270.1 hypothetical protein BFL28_10680 [Sphingomonas turrisvirgatae]
MNAQTTITADAGSIEGAYRATISAHCPNQSELAMQARIALAQLRARASAGARRCSDEAAPVLHHVAVLAGETVYAPLPEGKLHLVVGALSSLMSAARHVERAVNWTQPEGG